MEPVLTPRQGWVSFGGGRVTPAVIVHGGAGAVPEDEFADRLQVLQEARQAAWEIVNKGGDAVSAVVAAVVILEDSPLFNAGTGSALNREGFVEMDAAVMDGETRAFGGVAAVRDVKNPVVLAREVMNSEHVLLACEGASRFARERGIPAYDPARLITERQIERWQKARRRASGEKSGTVGAAVMDASGRLAAATSTGGMVDQRLGRVGDTPLPGAGNYAEAGLGAASGTGYGEYFMRSLATYRAVSALRRLKPQDALQQAVVELASLGGHGGIILVDSGGRTYWHHDTESMCTAWRDSNGEGAACRR